MKLAIPDADVLWDGLPALRRYAVQIMVQESDLDDLHHVNNTIYLVWCEQAARRHALSVGLGTPELVALGAVPVATQHVIRYHKPAVLGDTVRIRTALTYSEGLRSTRAYTLDRLNPHDPAEGVRLAECQTDWVWVDPASGRPRRIPAEVFQRFGFR